MYNSACLFADASHQNTPNIFPSRLSQPRIPVRLGCQVQTEEIHFELCKQWDLCLPKRKSPAYLVSKPMYHPHMTDQPISAKDDTMDRIRIKRGIIRWLHPTRHLHKEGRWIDFSPTSYLVEHSNNGWPSNLVVQHQWTNCGSKHLLIHPMPPDGIDDAHQVLTILSFKINSVCG